MSSDPSMKKAFEEAVACIEEIPKFTKKNTPEVTRRYLDLLGAPDREMRIIHVAGTNGKGSVCCYLSGMLRAAGHRTGVFISPHLVDLRERMSIDGEMISMEDFLSLYEQVRAVSGEEGLPAPAYFEFLFLLAMLWFKKEAPDFVILETGLGGRLDATNTVSKKELCVITEIGFDHMQYLGNTLEQIAGEKAGILQSRVPAVFLDAPSEAYETIHAVAEKLGAPCEIVKESEYSGEMTEEGFVEFCGGSEKGIHAVLHTPALYQAQNAALAVRAMEIIMKQEKQTTKTENVEAMVRGLEGAQWPGRMEEILPDVWLDGAHNMDGIRAFVESVSKMKAPDYGKRILLFSAVRDKEFLEEMKVLADAQLFDVWITVPMEGSRALSGDELRQSVKEIGATGILVGSVKDVREAVLQIIVRKEAEDQIFAAGSLYLVGELRKLLEKYAEDLKDDTI